MIINQDAVNRALTFIENLKHTKGEWAGQPFKLMAWQKDIVTRLFGTLNPDGTRQYRTCYIEVPRKNGKSTLAAAIANYLLFADGEAGAEIYSAAADRGQASLVFNEAAHMVRTHPALLSRSKVLDSVKRIIIPRNNSFYQTLSAEAYTKHGLNAHGIIFDELHTQKNRELWDVLTTSGGTRRQPLTVAITTAGVDRNSICWELHDYAQKILSGIVEDDTFLPVIYAATDDDNWEDESVWYKANPGLGEFRSIDEMKQMYRRAKETPALEMTFRQLYLNQWVSSYERWLPMDKWDTCGAPFALKELDGQDCYAGLDLASTTDLTALVLVFPNGEGGFQVIPHFWIPLDNIHEAAKRDRVPYPLWLKQGLIHATAGNIIDYTAVEATIDELAEIYHIREIAFDNWNACRLSQDLTDKGYTMVPFSQSVKNMSPPTKELMNITLSGKLKHGGHPVLRWNADNMMVYRDSNDNLKPNKQKATGRIDGMVALIMALDRAIKHENITPHSVYENRGVISFDL
ncbi:terminase large subunit [Dehalococcoides mccartyi]|jgi:phage terminase large subunit-like protein|uniref:terminase large subunit n=1 Tax=Dehalococcoides mccartyi TaxID=61435 RepID=UPI00098FCEFE|nr:terminase TerL endonuclease subunit [Dehalococcoides mccartyi]AQU06098.1 terminase [Dehalococcoides mccartyi]AQU07541.1 terminase [Dehalococcoides mccartyi]AQX74787.1 terminase [Dehalococcoides mccartyi]AQY73364.1 terminase [Dehalococcoides mccartyi]QBX64064.1 terminase large subunit [Dehalococcoides mccartyi]